VERAGRRAALDPPTAACAACRLQRIDSIAADGIRLDETIDAKR
jgi:hypothetical protein